MTKKEGLQLAAGKRHIFAGRAWQRLRVDLVIILPETEKENRQIWVAVDHFAR